jgi:SNF2 family DNA or RNA helicase
MENYNAKKVLIICKKSLKTQWKKDGIEKFIDGLDTEVISGTAIQRGKQYQSFAKNKGQVMIVSYKTVMQDEAYLGTVKFDFILIDESHKIATRKGKMNAAITSVCQSSKCPILFLTGTPIMSTPEDLYGIVQIANKRFFPGWDIFRGEHILMDTSSKYYDKIAGYKNLDKLREKVQDIIIRRTEYEVDTQLPEQILERVDIDMDSTQIKLAELLSEDIAGLKVQIDMEKDVGKKATLVERFKMLGICRQAVANDPRLFLLSNSKYVVETYGKEVSKTYKMSSKTEALLDIIQTVVDSGNKIIIFTRFERAVRMLAEDIKKELNLEVVTYTGKIDDANRDINVTKFWNDPDCNVFVSSTAGEEGLNLQCAKYVVNYDQPDSPGQKIQRFGRVRRVGSTYSHVHMYDLITLESKDEEKLKELEAKGNLFTGLVDLDEAQSKAMREAIKND